MSEKYRVVASLPGLKDPSSGKVSSYSRVLAGIGKVSTDDGPKEFTVTLPQIVSLIGRGMTVTGADESAKDAIAKVQAAAGAKGFVRRHQRRSHLEVRALVDPEGPEAAELAGVAVLEEAAKAKEKKAAAERKKRENERDSEKAKAPRDSESAPGKGV